MENAVNSVEILNRDNTEPSLVGNNLEGVTTRGEPKAEAMVIIPHSIESNLIEKRSAPDKKGDDIVWSCGKSQESGGNDLATFGEFNFNVAGTAIGNQVIKMVSRFPITIERNIRADVVNVKALSELGFSQSTKSASVVVSLAGFCRLLTPVLAFVSLNVSLVSLVVGTSAKGGTAPNMALLRAIFPIGFSTKVLKGVAAMRTNFRDWANEAGIILARIDLTAKFQRAFAATSFFEKRPLGDRVATDNAGLELKSANTPAFPRAKSSIPARKFLAANTTLIHSNMIAQSDLIVN